MGKRSTNKPLPPAGKRGPARPRPAVGRSAAWHKANALVPGILDRLNRGDVVAGMRMIETGMTMAPEHPEFPHLAGQVQLGLPKGDGAKARQLLERAVELAPDNARYQVTLGGALLSEGDLDSALKRFRKALKADSHFAQAHMMVGIVLAKSDRQREAAEAFANAARLEPQNPECWLNLAVCRMALSEPEGVIEAVERLEKLIPEPPPQLLHQLGNIYRGVGRFPVAERYYRRSLDLAPDSASVWFALADVLAQAGEYLEALPALERAEQLGYRIASTKAARIDIAIEQGDVAAAKTLLAEAVDAAGDNPRDLKRVARQCTLIGDFRTQEICLKRVLASDPDDAGAFASLMKAPGRRLDRDQAKKLATIVDQQGAEKDARRQAAFALGDYYRYEKDYKHSMDFYRRGNKLKGYSFDRFGYERWIDWVEQNLTQAFFAERANYGSDSRLPILIVGMPRSGTTLTEQIVSSHPLVHGAGEYGSVSGLSRVGDLPNADIRRNKEALLTMTLEQSRHYANAYLDKMQALIDDQARYVTNKLPHNFQQLGLFGLLFPKAPVIHVKRDPRDNLLSIYFQDFVGFHDYAYDLKTLGRYYRLYERLMDHWASVIQNPIYELQYEELVEDLADKTAEMARFIGVDLDDRMLRFWEQERKVETASKWQVRQPLYTSSVGRWRPYKDGLQPLFDGLGIQ